jgi:hypothetical protein
MEILRRIRRRISAALASARSRGKRFGAAAADTDYQRGRGGDESIGG